MNFYNSPITWIKKSLEHYIDYNKPNKDKLLRKILLGLPFHGAMMELDDKSPKISALNGKAFGEILQGDLINEMTYDKKEKENLFTFNLENKNYISTFPSNMFFKERLNFCLENKLGGVGIWDVAQGFDIFLDEF